MRISKKPDWQQEIAKERIEILFDIAEKEFKKHPDRSKRYIQLARKISLRYNVRLPRELKKAFCKNCDTLLKPGITSQVRLDKSSKTVNTICLNCKKVYRYPYK